MSQIALLWDESYLWAVMAYRSLKKSSISFKPIRASDIRDNALKQFQLLFVPGGWASNKMKALGDIGIKKIREFIRDGGNYLGFCGGAGLATSEGIGLLRIKRVPTEKRVPSLSGPVLINPMAHPIWSGISSNRFYLWWPSQFLIDEDSVKVLANFEKATAEAYSSDLKVGDIEAFGDWETWEKLYGINLNPEKMKGFPLVIEGNYHKGKIVLSLIHFDTPDDSNSLRIFKNLFEYLSSNHEVSQCSKESSMNDKKLPPQIENLEKLIEDLIKFGERNFLWMWRNNLILKWKRGIRGLEYCTLYVMIKEIIHLIQIHHCYDLIKNEDLGELTQILESFILKAKKTLLLERFQLQRGNLTSLRCEDSELAKLRKELFGTEKRHGGEFKTLIEKVDFLLFSIISQIE